MSKTACFRGSIFYSFCQEFFLPPTSQSVYTADGGCRGSYAEQRALEQNSAGSESCPVYLGDRFSTCF